MKIRAKMFHILYSVGAAIVIIAALGKINHYSWGSMMMAVGLTIEACIFLLSAFDLPKDDYQWERVYPELTDENAEPALIKRAPAKKEERLVTEARESLSQKLDDMMKEARLETALFDRLRVGIENFSHAVEDIGKTTSAAAGTQKYSEQISVATHQMESLNAIYKVQIEQGNRQVEIGKTILKSLEKTNEDSESLSSSFVTLSQNLTDLNKVYGGMLSAMNITR